MRRPFPRIRSARLFIDRMEQEGIKNVPPLHQLRPPMTLQVLKDILDRTLIEIWNNEPITANGWDVLARAYYSPRFQRQIIAQLISAPIRIFAFPWALFLPPILAIVLAAAGVTAAYIRIRAWRVSPVDIAGGALGACVGVGLCAITVRNLPHEHRKWVFFTVAGILLGMFMCLFP